MVFLLLIVTIVYRKCKKKSILPIKYYGRKWKMWNKYIGGEGGGFYLWLCKDQGCVLFAALARSGKIPRGEDQRVGWWFLF